MEGVEKTVFQCATAKGQWISVCADAQSAMPSFVQYRFGKPEKVELAKPDVDAGNLARWSFSERALARGMSRSYRFTTDGYGYEVFVTEAGMDTAAGVVVSKGEKVLATLTCADQTWSEDFAAVSAIGQTAAP